MQPDQIFDFEAEHSLVFYEAMKLFKDRSMVRGQMWLEWPPSDKIRELRERIMRIEQAYVARERLRSTQPEVDHSNLDDALVEDAIDIINYANFLVKQIRREMYG
jgi:hypothetical protein